jgi:hypothetical protein
MAALRCSSSFRKIESRDVIVSMAGAPTVEMAGRRPRGKALPRETPANAARGYGPAVVTG